MGIGQMDLDELARLNECARGLLDAGRHAEAAEIFRRVVAHPGTYGARINLAQCEWQLGQDVEAEARAMTLLGERPDFVPALLLLADVKHGRDDFSGAADLLSRAVHIAPRHGAIWRRLGDVYQQSRDYEAACRSYERAFREDPHDAASLAALVALKRALCDWSGLDRLSMQLRDVVAKGIGVVQPLAFLGEPATAIEQRACAVAWRQRRLSPMVPAPVSPSRHRGVPRFGFVSYGFGAHPTAILTPAFLGILAKRGVELQLFCTGPDDGSHYRERFAALAPLHDVATLDTRAFAGYVKTLGIDILVDLDGYSRDRVPSVFAERPSPLQICWLGFPGTTGADCFDYVLADRFVLPPSLAAAFTEPVAYLPGCYQPNDPTRRVPDPPGRSELGLPEDSLVFVCFNASQKLNPRSFGRMIRILREVPDSVLWLLEGPGLAKQRIQARAEALGVASQRIVFMPKQAHAAYLGAYRHADLFLDTEYYNAHTTASDAMWAGCPVLTRPGETFASRVAGSLNHHAGLAELNATDDHDFVRRAVRIGRDPVYRAALKSRLSLARKELRLFDMEHFANDFLGLMERLWRQDTPRTNSP